MLTLIAQAQTSAQEIAPWAATGFTGLLVLAVVWLSKAYREDTKEQSKLCALERKEDRAEFRESLKEIKDTYTATVDKQNETLSDLCDSVRKLQCHGRVSN